jgi:hypothetical protein
MTETENAKVSSKWALFPGVVGSAIASLACFGFGVGCFVTAFFSMPRTWDATVTVEIIFVVVGLVSVATGLLFAFDWMQFLRDLFSSPIEITGRVSDRRSVPVTDRDPKCYITLVFQEFEVSLTDYAKCGEGKQATVTYFPNSRTVSTVSVVRTDWLTSTVVALANAIRTNRDYTSLLILADALEEAGYPNDQMLRRCRQANSDPEWHSVMEGILEQIGRAATG